MTTLSRLELVRFLRQEKHGVMATLAADGAPQAAVVGYVVDDDLQLLIDTVATTRKCQNIRRDARFAFVATVGSETVQLEGVADEPTGPDLLPLLARYLESFPDGVARRAWPDLTYIRMRPTWARYSDFRGAEPRIAERRFE